MTTTHEKAVKALKELAKKHPATDINPIKAGEYQQIFVNNNWFEVTKQYDDKGDFGRITSEGYRIAESIIAGYAQNSRDANEILDMEEKIKIIWEETNPLLITGQAYFTNRKGETRPFVKYAIQGCNYSATRMDIFFKEDDVEIFRLTESRMDYPLLSKSNLIYQIKQKARRMAEARIQAILPTP